MSHENADVQDILRRLMETMLKEKLSDDLFESLIQDMVVERLPEVSPSIIFDSSGLSVLRDGVFTANVVKI